LILAFNLNRNIQFYQLKTERYPEWLHIYADISVYRAGFKEVEVTMNKRGHVFLAPRDFFSSFSIAVFPLTIQQGLYLGCDSPEPYGHIERGSCWGVKSDLQTLKKAPAGLFWAQASDKETIVQEPVHEQEPQGATGGLAN